MLPHPRIVSGSSSSPWQKTDCAEGGSFPPARRCQMEYTALPRHSRTVVGRNASVNGIRQIESRAAAENPHRPGRVRMRRDVVTAGSMLQRRRAAGETVPARTGTTSTRQWISRGSRPALADDFGRQSLPASQRHLPGGGADRVAVQCQRLTMMGRPGQMPAQGRQPRDTGEVEDSPVLVLANPVAGGVELGWW